MLFSVFPGIYSPFSVAESFIFKLCSTCNTGEMDQSDTQMPSNVLLFCLLPAISFLLFPDWWTSVHSSKLNIHPREGLYNPSKPHAHPISNQHIFIFIVAHLRLSDMLSPVLYFKFTTVLGLWYITQKNSLSFPESQLNIFFSFFACFYYPFVSTFYSLFS